MNSKGWLKLKLCPQLSCLNHQVLMLPPSTKKSPLVKPWKKSISWSLSGDYHCPKIKSIAWLHTWLLNKGIKSPPAKLWICSKKLTSTLIMKLTVTQQSCSQSTATWTIKSFKLCSRIKRTPTRSHPKAKSSTSCYSSVVSLKVKKSNLASKYSEEPKTNSSSVANLKNS